MTKIYGIKNCDTMKKALDWLEDREVSYEFHDYKKQGADKAVLQEAIQAHGWEDVLNRRGTTWRQLCDDMKNNMDDKSAIKVAMENPSIIKRPLLVKDNEIYLGFSPTIYEKIF
jgi:Spx/MgsR family transcriptional regulator